MDHQDKKTIRKRELEDQEDHMTKTTPLTPHGLILY